MNLTILVPFEEFGEIQKQIVTLKTTNPAISYKKIIEEIRRNTSICLYDHDLSSCLFSSALGFKWDKATNKPGRRPYLCPKDLQELKNRATAMAREADGALDPAEFIDTAVDLKTSRISKATLFLWKIGCKKLALSIGSEETIEPTRPWVNDTVKEIGMQLKSPIYLDADRVNTGNLRKLISFYEQHEQLIENCPFQLMFGADETMLDTTLRGKLIVDLSDPHPILTRDALKLPHVTSMCCHTVSGVPLPPFIILPKLNKLPEELREFAASGQAWFASSQSGWMCRDLFLIWTIHFINWLSIYRTTLAETIRNARALLIVDGHSSRECPIALQLLRSNGVDVLVLPGHTTHITQMFDVCLASAVKSKYTKLLNKLLKESTITAENKTAKARYCSVRAFISAWHSVCTHDACMSAAKKTGFYPFNAHAIEESPFVRDIPVADEAQRRVTRLEIGGKVITSVDMINAIANMLGNCPQYVHLRVLPRAGLTYIDYVNEVCKTKLPNDCCFIGRIPPYKRKNGIIHTFE